MEYKLCILIFFYFSSISAASTPIIYPVNIGVSQTFLALGSELYIGTIVDGSVKITLEFHSHSSDIYSFDYCCSNNIDNIDPSTLGYTLVEHKNSGRANYFNIYTAEYEVEKDCEYVVNKISNTY